MFAPICEQDYTDDLNDRFQTCDIAPHLFTISLHHSPPEHGGRLYSRPDIGVYTEVILYGVHDSDDYLAADPLLEDTGTYSVRPTHSSNLKPVPRPQLTITTFLTDLPCSLP